MPKLVATSLATCTQHKCAQNCDTAVTVGLAKTLQQPPELMPDKNSTTPCCSSQQHDVHTAGREVLATHGPVCAGSA